MQFSSAYFKLEELNELIVYLGGREPASCTTFGGGGEGGEADIEEEISMARAVVRELYEEECLGREEVMAQLQEIVKNDGPLLKFAELRSYLKYHNSRIDQIARLGLGNKIGENPKILEWFYSHKGNKAGWDRCADELIEETLGPQNPQQLQKHREKQVLLKGLRRRNLTWELMDQGNGVFLLPACVGEKIQKTYLNVELLPLEEISENEKETLLALYGLGEYDTLKKSYEAAKALES